MSDNSDTESVDRDPTEEELAIVAPTTMIDEEDEHGMGWESSVFDFENFGEMNGEGFLSLETVSGADFIVETNKSTGISSIKYVNIMS